jgi:excisionase family DNA binding protein
MADEAEMITHADAAAELGVSLATLYRWLAAREIPTYRKIGDRRGYVSRADLAQLRSWQAQPRSAKKDAA